MFEIHSISVCIRVHTDQQPVEHSYSSVIYLRDQKKKKDVCVCGVGGGGGGGAL